MSENTISIPEIGDLDLGKTLIQQPSEAVKDYFMEKIAQIDPRNAPEECLLMQEFCGTRISDGKEINRPCCLKISDPEKELEFKITVVYHTAKTDRRAFAVKDYQIEML